MSIRPNCYTLLVVVNYDSPQKGEYNLDKATSRLPCTYAGVSDFWEAKIEAAYSYEITCHHITADINHNCRHHLEFIFFACSDRPCMAHTHTHTNRSSSYARTINKNREAQIRSTVMNTVTEYLYCLLQSGKKICT